MIIWDIICYVIEIIWLINLVLVFWMVFWECWDIVLIWVWLLVLFFLLVVGFVVYFFVGCKLLYDQIFII